MQIPHFKLERFFAKYEFNVDYLLCCSDCESLTIQELLGLEPDASERFYTLRLGYTESPGSPSLRRTICSLYDSIAPDQVLVHCGAEEAIFLFMHAALKAGEHIIVHWPCYQSLVEVARSIGCQVTLWQARAENDWALDIDELQQHIRPNTKVIVINTPHNPTGYLMPLEEFKELNRITQSNGIILFSDEVYRESEHSESDRLPAACDASELAVSLGVMSKTYGLPGLRIGWIATRNTEIYAYMGALKDYTTICNSAPSEFLAELALRHRVKLVKRNVGIITQNIGILNEFFDRHQARFAWKPPKAGPIAFPKLIGEDVEVFCKDLVRTARVLLLPGTMYNDRGNHFRVGFGRKNLPEAIKRLGEFIKTSP
jgi:aspartate/methionine/tyrosine aminotransferase